MPRKSSQFAALGGAVLSLALLAGCAAPAPAPTDDGELTPVSVGILPLGLLGAVYVAIDEGIFEEHGLEVELVPQSDIGTIVSGVASSQYEFGFVPVPAVINARNNGVPIKMVAAADGLQSPEESETIGNTLVAAAGSGIESVADLEGKTVAVVGLSSLSTLSLWQLADDAGIDPKSIALVQIPYPQMASQLETGAVDAAITNDPFVVDALATGATILVKPNSELYPGMTLTSFTANEQLIASDPDTVRAFGDAILEAIAFAHDNPDVVRASFVTHLGMTPEAAEAAELSPNMAYPGINTKAIPIMQDLMVEFEGLTDVRPESEFIWDGVEQTD